MMLLEIDFSVNNCAIRFDIDLDLAIGGQQFARTEFDIELDTLFRGNSEYGYAMLPRIQSIGGEIDSAYGAGFAYLPAIKSHASGGFYIPPPLEYGYAVLPSIVSFGIIKTSSPGNGLAYLPSIQSKGGEGPYGEGSGVLPPFYSKGHEGPPKYTKHFLSAGLLFGEFLSVTDQIVVFNSSGRLIDTITASSEYVASLLSSMQLSDSFTVIGEYSSSFVSSGMLRDSIIAAQEIDGVPLPGVDRAGRVWVVNMDTGSSGQYDGYGFNSFLEEDGEYYGIAKDGIYRLDGDTDNGIAIQALIECGRSNLGSPQAKKVINVYAGVSSTGKMLLKVDADGSSYVYEARASSEEIKNQRFDVGKGLRGNYYNFTLMNQDGCDFDLETITFEPVVLSRKI